MDALIEDTRVSVHISRASYIFIGAKKMFQTKTHNLCLMYFCKSYGF
jgi:hypothetical protein